jgi:phage shock protein PspC (stress-responsive transcriptional regulator)
MRPVISVSLNGRAYQLEDDAHAALANYLDSAARALASNPDRAEILADLEQAIADKCTRFLNPHKTVVARSEIEQVIGEMGPVDPGAGTAARDGGGSAGAEDQGGGAAGVGRRAADRTSSTASKRLYQITDGALISGVCNGLAVYLDVDVTLVRLLFIIAAVITGGLAVIAYVVMMFIVPYANTPEELAAARGLPFNARVLVEQAKLKAAQLADAATHAAMHNSSPAARARWKAEWRKMRAQWRYERRRNRAQWRAYHWTGIPAGAMPPATPPPPMPPLAHFISGLTWAALGLLATAVTLGWLLALFSLVTTGAVFGWIPLHLPLWASVVGLILIYQVIVWPLRAVRHAVVPHYYGYSHPWHSFWDALVGLLVLAILVWLFTHHGDDLQQSFDSIQRNAQPAWHRLVLAWQTLVDGAKH